MRNKYYRNSKLKHELLEEKKAGNKQTRRRLNSREKKFVTDALNLKCEEPVYRIYVKKIPDPSKRKGVLKGVNHAYATGKTYIDMELTERQKMILRKNGVRYKLLHYTVYLQA